MKYYFLTLLLCLWRVEAASIAGNTNEQGVYYDDVEENLIDGESVKQELQPPMMNSKDYYDLLFPDGKPTEDVGLSTKNEEEALVPTVAIVPPEENLTEKTDETFTGENGNGTAKEETHSLLGGIFDSLTGVLSNTAGYLESLFKSVFGSDDGKSVEQAPDATENLPPSPTMVAAVPFEEPSTSYSLPSTELEGRGLYGHGIA